MASTNTTIEWTDRTWNPVRGCTRVSTGCTHCYAERLAGRFGGPGKPFEGLTKKVGKETRWTGKVMLVKKELETPFKWKEPQRIFVNSVSDLFHEDVPFWFIDEVFMTMATADWHTYQVLTKRPARMLEYFKDVERRFQEGNGNIYLGVDNTNAAIHKSSWPLHNVWIGTSVENQAAADERIPLLVKVPAAVRFLSCEPLLGPITLDKLPCPNGPHFDGYCVQCCNDYNSELFGFITPLSEGLIDLVIVGGESGPGARPMHPRWALSIRDQCQQAGAKFFFKQHGEWLNIGDYDPFKLGFASNKYQEKSVWYRKENDPKDLPVLCLKVGKKLAGRELEGRTWDEMPEVVKV